MTYSMEVLGPTRRSISGAMTHVYFSIGYMATSGVAYFLPDWRGFTLCYAGICALAVFTIPFYPESPSFLYSQKKTQQAREILEGMADSTNSEIPASILDKIEDDMNKQDEVDESVETKVQTYTMLDLFKYKSTALISLNIGLAFTANTLVYYGLSFNVDSLSGSVYVNNVVNGFVELLAYIVVMGTLDKFGEKSLNSSVYNSIKKNDLLIALIEKLRTANGLRWSDDFRWSSLPRLHGPRSRS